MCYGLEVKDIKPIIDNVTIDDKYILLTDRYEELKIKIDINQIESEKDRLEYSRILHDNPLTYYYYKDDYGIIIKPYSIKTELSKFHNPTYGENSTCLGQFRDNFNNYSYIDTYHNVIVNTTLNCVELDMYNGSISYSPVDIWTTGGFIEVDAGGDNLKNINGTEIWFDNVDRDEGDRIYKSFGPNFFDGGWEYHFRVYIVDSHTDNARCSFMMISESNEDQTNMIINDRDFVEFFIQWRTVGSVWELQLRGWDEGELTSDYELSSESLDLDRWYHVIYSKVGDNITAWFYNNALMTDLDFMLTVIDDDITDLRYLHPLNSQDQATGGRSMDLFLNRVVNCTTGLSYYNSGYFITTDYLSSPNANGISLVSMTNATILNGTLITVQYSNDNITWYNNKKQAGYNTLVDGFLSIDMRYLLYSDRTYKRYNFTTVYNTVTPKLFQSRLISSVGMVTGSNEYYVVTNNRDASIILVFLSGIIVTLIFITISILYLWNN